MIGKLIWPVITCVLLAGCMTGYRYNSGYGDYGDYGYGDYYYGQPDVDYRYGGRSYYGYGSWPYRGYSRYGYGYGGLYGFSRYYGYPYYPRYYYRSHYRYGHHDYDDDHDHDDHDDDYVDNNVDPPRRPNVDNDGSLPPWRELGDVRIRKSDPLSARRIRAPLRQARQTRQARQAPAGRTPPRRPISRPAPRPSPPPSISTRSRSSTGSSDRDTRDASPVRRPQRPGRISDERREQ